jgi:hypothetical protein
MRKMILEIKIKNKNQKKEKRGNKYGKNYRN